MNGVASLDASGLIPITQIPQSAIAKLVIVATQVARYALTTATVQNGDTVKQTDTGEMWYVIDELNLANASGYSVYTAGTASAVALSGMTGMGTGVSNALAIAIGTAGSPIINGGVLGTPSSGNFSTGTFTWPTFNQSTTGSAATLTTTRAIYGNNFDGSAALTQIIASTYGGTGNGFTKLSGPTTAEKIFTLPNASASILTDNAVVTVAQ